MNYYGLDTDFIDFTVDRNPEKQGKFIAGVHIPILHPNMIYEEKPDFILVLPWNIKEEIMKKMQNISKWNGKFIVLNPEVKLFDAFSNEISIKNNDKEKLK